MQNDLSPAAVVRALDQGQDVVIPASRGFLLRRLILSVVVGAVCLGVQFVIVGRDLAGGTTWTALLLNLRFWVFPAAAVLFLIVFPWALIRRLLHHETVVLTPRGVAETRSGAVRPDEFLPWDDIEEVLFEPLRRFAPRALAYRLTATAADERGLAETQRRRLLVRSGYRLGERRLFDVLRAAHAWSGERRR